ncbi:rho guanine nucleotide exchange factor 37 [Gadus morhua]|uniref:Rho guanine nucleotide exchange factor 37 n=1 Tax=Gadus morhua TaxID=8049 RepID=A0A8C5B0H3_GADMO|nr:rho guanine nucleotide exchange factor 37 [Gadus morhua]
MQVSRRAQPASPQLALPSRDSSDFSPPGGDGGGGGGGGRGEEETVSEEMDFFTDEEVGEDIGAYLGLDMDLSGSLEALGAKLSDSRISAEETADSPRTTEGGAGALEVRGHDEEELEADRTRLSEEEAEEAAAREKAAQRQLLAIEELVHTERNYLRLLQLASVTIRNNLSKMEPPLVGLSSMFLHVEEVMEVSGRLLSLLDQKLVKPGDPQYLHILCDSFLSMSPDIEESYKEFLANYTLVTTLENTYKQKEALWTEIVKVIKTSAPEVNATSLSFFLVMPVQRIARYPLLLQTIKKHTETAHPAYKRLEEAAHTAIALNCRINEYKRFREVADKYKKTETLSIKDKINRLNSHSIAKKTARLSQYIKHETGMASKLVDEEFDALEMFFYVLEKGILELHDNVGSYLCHLQEFLACRPEECDLDLHGNKPAICYKEIQTALRQWILPTFEKRMRSLIYKPLCSLRDLLAGPRNLIRKRLDKLLDYEVLEARPSLNYEEQAIASTYRTINTLLLNELPQFNGLALGMMWSVLGTFSSLHLDLTSDMEQLFQGFAQQLPHSSLEPGAFWEWVEHAVLEGARNLESVCCNVEETLSAPISQPLSPSSQRRLALLTQKHGSEKIFQVSGAVVGGRDLDLSLGRGELVAVVSQKDSRGDKRRWLVDAGGPRGYAPSAKLIRYRQAVEDPPPSPHLTLPVVPAGQRRHSYSPETRSLTLPAMSRPCFQVFVSYDFTASGAREFSVRAGEAVRVLESHDKGGNPDWSLVEAAQGRRGYVPSNYLVVMPTTPTGQPTAPGALSSRASFH